MAIVRVACSHTHTLAYGSDVNEAALYEAKAANISPLLYKIIISRRCR